MRFGVADYGMNVWDGGCFDAETRWSVLKGIGYDGVERMVPISAEDAVRRSASMHALGFEFATCLGPTVETSIQWTAAFRKPYVWTQVTGQDFDTFCRQVNIQVRSASQWGVRVGLHNHLGSLVETQAQLETFLARCPDCGLLLDTAHLAAAGGDPVDILRRYSHRLVAVHLKDWEEIHPEIALDRWWERGRFCKLGCGNIGMDNIAVMHALVDVGYDGWVFVEQDTHLGDPCEDLAFSRDYLRQAGF